MRVGEARGGEVYMRKERHLMATVKILGWPTRTDVVTAAGKCSRRYSCREIEGSRQLRRLCQTISAMPRSSYLQAATAIDANTMTPDTTKPIVNSFGKRAGGRADRRTPRQLAEHGDLWRRPSTSPQQGLSCHRLQRVAMKTQNWHALTHMQFVYIVRSQVVGRSVVSARRETKGR